MKNQPVLAALIKGATLDGYLAVKKAEARTASTGKKYLDMVLCDSTACIGAKVWDGVSDVPQEGSVIRVRCRAEEFRGRLQLRVEKYREAQAGRDDFDPEALSYAGPYEPEQEEKPEPELRNITVQKIWVDNDNRDGNRPESVTVRLLAGGEEIRTAVLRAENGWKYTFTDLPKTAHGNWISYFIKEDPVKDYVTQVSGFTVRNIYRPETTTDSVRKVWDDNNNIGNIRPAAINVQLYTGEGDAKKAAS